MRDISLLDHVLSTSVVVPDSWEYEKIMDAFEWCKRTFGEDRGGHIFHEAEEGWLDFFEGNWCMRWDESKSPCLFWFSTKDRLTQFTLTWG